MCEIRIASKLEDISYSCQGTENPVKTFFIKRLDTVIGKENKSEGNVFGRETEIIINVS
ncbi:hypothetical protein Clim_0364 [Chlorobium limicola DSM 245]|uniref:Uncharacterized protein n=1 Tax=Chlorobium limicola (strain DSM 245 / NBRC 103803 / 6330) TaxID=290315 RepID=B3EFH4_CHLL2|nr:hypothetical protein Clim_0364 [Chlorobium limicola DSM 245]